MDSAPQATPGYRAVLAVPEFRVLWLAHVGSVLGDQVTRIVLAAVVLERTGSVALSALSFATTFVPWLVGGPLLSLLADRQPRRTVMVACDAGRALLLALMAVPGVPVWTLFALAAASALLGPPFEAARGATMPDVLPGPLYPVAQSLSMAGLQVAQLGGLALGGLLVTLHPGPGVLLLDAVSFAASAVALRLRCGHRPGATAGAGATRSWLRDSAEGALVVARTPDLRRLLALSCVTAAVVVVPEGLAVVQAHELGESPLTAGLLSAVLPLGSAVGAVLLGRVVPPHRRLALAPALAVVAAVACTACLLRPGLPGLVVLWTLAGAGAAGLLPANVAFVVRLDPAVRGRALSVAQVLLQVSQGLAVAAAGAVAAHVGASAATGCAGLVALVLVVALGRRWPTAQPHGARRLDPARS